MSGLSQEARSLIDGVSELDGPSPSDKARIQQRLALQLGAAAFTASVLPLAAAGGTAAASASVAEAGAAVGKGLGTLASKSLWLGSLGKALLGAAALGGVGVALWVGTPPQAPAAPRQSPASLAAPAPVEAAPEPVAAPALQELPSQDSVVAAPAPAVAASLPEPARPSAAPRSAARVKAASDHARDLAVATPQAAAPAETLGDELALLGRAHAALRAGRFQEALALSAEHRSRFPEGVMREERMGVAALAECGLSPTQRDAAQAFLKQAAGSPLAARVRKACELP